MKTILIVMLIDLQKCETVIPLLKSTDEQYAITCRYCIPIHERCLWAVHDDGVPFNRTELSPGTRVMVVEYAQPSRIYLAPTVVMTHEEMTLNRREYVAVKTGTIYGEN